MISAARTGWSYRQVERESEQLSIVANKPLRGKCRGQEAPVERRDRGRAGSRFSWRVRFASQCPTRACAVDLNPTVRSVAPLFDESGTCRQHTP